MLVEPESAHRQWTQHLEGMDIEDDDAGGPAAGQRDVGQHARKRKCGCHLPLSFYLHNASAIAQARAQPRVLNLAALAWVRQEPESSDSYELLRSREAILPALRHCITFRQYCDMDV